MKMMRWVSKFFLKVSVCLLALFAGTINTHTQVKYLKFDNFRVEQGLSNNMVHCAFQDSKGWMWFGTSDGLNRFDGYKFINYLPIPMDTTSVRGTLIRSIVEDSKGYLWAGADNGGLNKFDRKKNRFKRFLEGKSIKCLKIQNDSILWIGSLDGLYKLSLPTEKIQRFSHNPSIGNSLRENYVRSLEADNSGNLWIGTIEGLDYREKGSEKFKHITYTSQHNNDEIQHLFIDNEGNLWISTFNFGFYIFNPKTQKSENYIPDKNYERSFSARKIICDKDGIYWVTTRGGLYLFNKISKKFTFYSYSDRDPNSLCNNSILDIFSDQKGDIWLGTRGGVSYMAHEKQVFKHYKSFVDDNRYLNNPEIYAFWLEKNGNLWIGTESGGINIFNPNTGTYRYITRGNDLLQSNTIKAFAADGKGNLCVASFLGGLNIVDINAKKVKEIFLHDPKNSASISDNRVWSVHTDFYGNIWVGTEMGLDRFDSNSGKFIHYNQVTQGKPALWISEDPDHELWISTSNKTCLFNPQDLSVKVFNIPGRYLFVDSKGRYWLSSYHKGLILIDKQKGVRKIYAKKEGLVDKRTHYILEDKSGFLWISTANGLSKFDPQTEVFTNYDINDGLQNNQFNYGAGLKLPSGEFVLGGVNGFNIFNPDELKSYNVPAPLVFTDFRIFYKPVPVSDSKDAILHQDISETESIVIPHDKNVFMIEFALLNFAKSHKNKYSYYLEGFDQQWNDAGIDNKAIYTNLNPGKYKLRVKTNTLISNGKNNEIVLSIRIMPPFWGTAWFKGAIVLILLVMVYILVKIFTYRNRLKQELVLERIKAKQVHELDLVKMKFFTNISHEIRTPLSLIINPVERLMQEQLTEKEMKGLLTLIHRNAGNLLRLVNQLLDFRKVETGNVRLEMKKGDIVSFINSVISTFQQMADDKGISLKFSAVQNEIFSFFDTDKVEKIINNLVSNAIKYTNRGGAVNVSISLVLENEQEVGESVENRYIEIVVKDSGIGISESNLGKIFNRFFQTNEMPNQTGTGIGLSFTKELVKLHKGKINVESQPQKGSRFTVLLPFIPEQVASNIASINATDNDSALDSLVDLKDNEEQVSDKILLVIEDNFDVRYYIRSQFEPDYKVVEAADGKEGINMAYKVIPDIIITDILMPGTDGIELCKKLKKDERTSHIPIILLTALTSRDSIHQGLMAGADDYITKPFDIMLLRTKVDNLFMLRKSLQMKYSGELLLQPKNITLASPEEKFLKKAIETVEKYIDDPDLDSDKFAQHIGVSRMQLYRKLGALTDMTVKDFIRDLRLKRAAQLLIQNKLNISEVAYAVGFRDLSHFRKCFRQEFGMTASEYVKKFGEEN